MMSRARRLALSLAALLLAQPALAQSGPIGHWPLDGDGADTSGYGRPVDVNGAPGFVTSPLGQAMQLIGDSTRHAVRPADDDAFDFGSGDFTIQLWVRFNTFSGEQVFLEKFEGPAGPGWTFAKVGADRLHFYCAPAAVMTTLPLGLSTGTWYRLAVRRSGALLQIFLNGSSVASTTLFGAIPDTTQPLYIGRRNPTGQDFPLNGDIDDVVIWARALSDAEIATGYVPGTITWTGTAGDGSWHTPGNWDLNRVPIAGDDVVIPSGAGTVSFSAGSTAVNSVTSGSAISQTGGTLDINTNGTFSGAYTLGNGTLSGSGDLTFNGGLTWTNGDFSGAGLATVPAGRTLNLSPASYVNLIGRTLEVFGTTDWTQGELHFIGNAQFINRAGATFNASGTSSMGGADGSVGNTFTNEGTFNKTGGGNVDFMQYCGPFCYMSVTNAATGVINVDGGALHFFNAWGTNANAGVIDIDAGATLTFYGVGMSHSAGASVTGAGAIFVSGGTTSFAAGSSFTCTGPISQTGGTLDINTDCTFSGAYTLSNGTLSGGGDMTFNGGLTWTGGDISGGAGLATVPAGRTLNLSPASYVNLIGRTLEVLGTTDWPQGGLHFAGNAQFINRAGATFNASGASSMGGADGSTGNTFTNEGTFNKTGGGNVDFMQYCGPFCYMSVINAATGVINVDGGALHFFNAWGTNANAGVIDIDAGATLSIACGSMSHSAGASVTGAGAISVLAGTTSFAAGSSFTCTGDISQTGGTLDINTDSTFSGAYTLSNGTLSGSGHLTFNGGLTWTGGDFSGGAGLATVPTGRTLNLSPPGYVNLIGRTLEVLGTTDWALGGVHFIGNAQFINRAGATFNASGTSSMGGADGSVGNTFTNEGTFNKTGGGNVDFMQYCGPFCYMSVTNAATGVINVDGGALRFLNAWGTNANAGVIDIDATLTLAGAALSHSTGSVLSGSGTIVGNVSTAGTVRPGGAGAAGTLTVDGNYTQGGTATLEIDIGGPTAGTQHDHLNVNGTATLGGTLRPMLINGYAPVPTQSFFFLSAATRSGTFTSLPACNVTVDYYPSAAFLSIDYSPPAITDPPDPLFAALGSTATFSAAASGAGPLTYQWRKDGANLSNGPTGAGSTISGATSPTLQIAGVHAADVGDYDVVVSSECASTASAAAALSLCTASPLDCDSNGTPDVQEPAYRDCNTNCTFDLCEANPDCDTNDTPDACELAGSDCNTNSTLDSCDARIGPRVSHGAMDVPVDIPDAQPAPGQGAFSEITIVGGGMVRDVDVLVDIRHTWDSDMDILLLHAGSTVTLSDDNGLSGHHYDGTVFDDQAAAPVTAGTAPFAGTYRPEEPLARFENAPAAGVWTLNVRDDAGADTGTLRAWALSLRASTSADCNTDGSPDECEWDCNTNGTPDACELVGADCDTNHTLDACELAGHDCNTNLLLDFCEGGCNTNAIPDACEDGGCNANGVPDECELAQWINPTASPNLPIGDNTVNFSDQTVLAAGAVADVNVGVNIQHTYDGDLQLALMHNGATVSLCFNRGGGGGDNFSGTWFDDAAGAAIAQGAAPFTGTYRPETPLAALNGSPWSGIWTLRAADTLSADTGTLLNWTLVLKGNPGSGDCDTNGILDGCDVAAPSTGGPATPPNVPKSIPEDDPAGINSDIIVNSSHVILDVNVGILIRHSFQGDVHVKLTHVDDGRTSMLCHRPGSPQATFGFSADNYGNPTTGEQMILDDSAATTYDLPQVAAPGIVNPTGAWRPETPLATFNGQLSNGTWRLNVADNAGGDTGTLVAWTLMVQTPAVLGDCNTDGRPDACELDCDTNGTPDVCELPARDCNTNGSFDDCEPGYADCNTNHSADSCEISRGLAVDCNTNGMIDLCEIAAGAQDCDTNRTLDLCEIDCDTNGTKDICDLDLYPVLDCNTNATPDSCEIDLVSNHVAGSALLGVYADANRPAFKADDFTLATETALTRVLVNGYFAVSAPSAALDEFTVKFWSNSAGLPAVLESSRVVSGADVARFPESATRIVMTLSLNPPISLAAGRHWLEVYYSGAGTDAGTNGTVRQWLWLTNLTSDGLPMASATTLPEVTWTTFAGQTESARFRLFGEPAHDCNTDGTLDECQGRPDCNTNGLEDACELSTPGAIRESQTLAPASPIPDNNAAGVVNSIPIAGYGVVRDVDVRINIRHGLANNLRVYVSHDAATVTLVSNPAVNGANFTNTLFDDQSTNSIGNIFGAQPPFTGTFHPVGYLAAFDGMEKHGLWNLRTVDSVSGNTGTLLSWSLFLQSPAPRDCNSNGVLDECDIALGGLLDVNTNGAGDVCEDCNTNGTPDVIESLGTDCNTNGIIDACDRDCDTNQMVDACEIAANPALDANSNGTPDACEASCPFCPGDVDGGNTVDGGDIAGFMRCCLGAPDAADSCPCADMYPPGNPDGVLDPDDVAAFVNKLLNDPDPACP